MSWALRFCPLGEAVRKYIPEKVDFLGTMRFQHVGGEGRVLQVQSVGRC